MSSKKVFTYHLKSDFTLTFKPILTTRMSSVNKPNPDTLLGLNVLASASLPSSSAIRSALQLLVVLQSPAPGLADLWKPFHQRLPHEWHPMPWLVLLMCPKSIIGLNIFQRVAVEASLGFHNCHGQTKPVLVTENLMESVHHRLNHLGGERLEWKFAHINLQDLFLFSL